MKSSSKQFQRKRILVGCEGESEKSYITALSRLLDEKHKKIHLDPVCLDGGDFLYLVERCEEHLVKVARNRDSYQLKMLLLDTDRLGQNVKRDDAAKKKAASLSLSLIWQNPCHEALLLNHFSGFEKYAPKGVQDARTKLRSQWTSYTKGLPARTLLQKLTRENILAAGERNVEFFNFLTEIDF